MFRVSLLDMRRDFVRGIYTLQFTEWICFVRMKPVYPLTVSELEEGGLGRMRYIFER
jgi:hypothetical protein